MKKLFLLLTATVGFSMYAICQVTPSISMGDTAGQNREKVFSKVDVAAAFPGGSSAWSTFLRNNLNANIATTSGAPSGSYTVIIQFIVKANGQLKNFTGQTHLGFGMESEAIRMLRNNSPNWIPALIAGQKVSSYFRQPITFVVP